MKQNNFIKEFKEINKNDAASAGGKGASLGEMTQAGITVPPGFVILADAFDSFLHQAEIHTEIDAILHKVDHKAMHTVEQASEEIKAIILGAQMPPEIAQEILTAFKKMDARFVAVRSSATAEDSSTAAWAGQLESYLNTTRENLLENVKKCWASLFTPRAIFYRYEQNLHQQHISVAVVVQKMVESEVSGIAFSVHPVTQDYNQLIIEAGYGLGEAIVSGQITPDSYVVEKKAWEIIDQNIATQTKALYRSKNGGNEWKEISGSEQKLSDAQMIELSKLVVKIEQHYGFPVDVEWALEKKKFYIVQSRPITTLAEKKPTEEREKVTPSQYHKLMNRSFPLIYFEGWYKGERFGLPNISKDSMFFDPLFIYQKNKGTDVLYNFTDNIQNPALLVEYFIKHAHRLKSLTEEHLKNYQQLIKLSKNKTDFSMKKLKEIFSFTLEMHPVLTAMVVIGNHSEERAEIVKISNQTRTATEDFVFKSIDLLLKNAIRLLPKEYQQFLYFLTYTEIIGKLPSIQTLRQRKEGYIYYQGKVYPAITEEEFAKKHNLEIMDSKINLSDKNEIKGNSAYRGKVIGKVRVVFEIEDMKKIEKGEILVTSMTTPDLIAVSREFSAIVTDEGGMLCHAAIISREFKKPCIIGTKIATQVLKDGDLVEVDADKGIVKILNRADKSRDFDALTQTKFKEYIQHHQFDIQKAIASFFGADLVYGAYSGAERFLGFNPSPILTYFKGRDFIQLIPQETLTKLTESFSQKYFCNQKKMDSFFDEHKKIRLGIDRLWKKYESENKKDQQSVLNFYDSLTAKSTQWWEYALYGENKGEIISQKVVAAIAKNKNLSESQAREAVSLFLHSDEISVFTRERLEFYHLCLEACQNKKINSLLEKQEYTEVLRNTVFDQKIIQYVQTYFFRDTDFYDRKTLTKLAVLKEIKETCSQKGLEDIKKDLSEIINPINKIIKKKKAIALELKLTPDEKNLLNLACKFVRWMDERKYGMMTQLYYFYSFFHHLSEQLAIPYEQIVALGVKDIRKIILGSKLTRSNSQTPKLHIYEKGQHVFAFLGQEADHQIEIISGLPPSLNDFSGIVACREKNNQKVKGKVKIIKDPVLEPFQQGDILVTSMTRIEFVPLMKKALAIITDEGGIACHAAIVSRELGIPCLIGTKIATQVLKDGDLVEVDADKGIIRIIKPILKEAKESSNETKWYHLGKWIEPALAAEVWLTYGEYAQQFFKEKLDGKILYINGNFFLSKHDFEIIKRDSYDAAKNHNKVFFENLTRTITSVSNRLVELSKNISSSVDFLKAYRELTGIWMPLNIVSIGVENYVNEIDSRAFEVACGNTTEKPWTLQQIDEMRMLKKELKTLPQKLEGLPKTMQLKINNHLSKYRWKGSHHFSIHTFTFDDLKKQIKEEDNENPKKKVNFSVDSYLVKLLDLMGFIRFRCAEASGISSYNLYQHLTELAKKHKISYEEIMEHTIEEIEAKNINKFIAEKRKKNTGFLFDDKIYILTDEEIEQYEDILLQNKNLSLKEIRGRVACKGKAKGLVKLVRSKEEMNGFEKSMILVAYETTPDVIVAMKKAAAIVTDFGGLTSHAAIISREFNIPCIVGTQNATQLLKDGDLVEVDADRGIVRIIQSQHITTPRKSATEISKPETKDSVQTCFGNWKLGITRNMSFWHMWQSSLGHFHHSKDFNINYYLQPLNITTNGTHSSIFYRPEQVAEYSKVILQSLNTLEGIKNLKSRYQKFSDELLFSLDQLNLELSLKNWDDFIVKHTRFCAGLFLTSIIGRAGLTKLTELLKKEEVADKDIPEIIAFITYPDEHTPLFKSQLDLLEIGVKVQQRISSNEKLSLLNRWLLNHADCLTIHKI